MTTDPRDPEVQKRQATQFKAFISRQKPTKQIEEIQKTEAVILNMLQTHKTYNPKEYPSDKHFQAAWIAQHIHQYFVLKEDVARQIPAARVEELEAVKSKLMVEDFPVIGCATANLKKMYDLQIIVIDERIAILTTGKDQPNDQKENIKP